MDVDRTGQVIYSTAADAAVSASDVSVGAVTAGYLQSCGPGEPERNPRSWRRPTG